MKVLLLLILITLSSCSQLDSTNESYSYIGVDLEKESYKKIPIIEGKKTVSGYGPEVDSKEVFEASVPSDVIGLYLYPAGFNSLSYLRIVSQLQKYQITPNVYSGAGMGAVIASLLAMGISPDHAEWKFFSLMESFKDSVYLSSEWKKVFFKFLKSEFEDKRIEELKYALILPIYDKKLGKVRYLSRGNLYNVLVINFDFNEESEYFQSPLLRGDLQISDLMDKGIDRLAVVNSLGEELSLSEGNHFLIGIYSKLAGLAIHHKEVINDKLRWFNINLKQVYMDKVKDLQQLMRNSVEDNDQSIVALREFMQKGYKK
ncbi:hypothetical protein [Halobacteriovorax sp. HLS]|uniref:hypothetical protein n=1 Tax=Halobacteriovorax sp. HLS TaxID=2234000 RepID=UPI000FDA90AA|nr:hypothetical protein [Halobacteriovorax sp. HLS]